ncbi:MAG: hypothetical protein Q7W30_07755, partial [Coriobacteriia bacterium]|nr:hypothetical protein [Coriobacteriia bacterium]
VEVTLGLTAHEWESSQNSANITNKVIVKLESSTVTRTDAASVAKYGTRAMVVSKGQIKSAAEATAYADKVLERFAFPTWSDRISVDSDITVKPGDYLSLGDSNPNGVGTENFVKQVTREMGAVWQEVILGIQPETVQVKRSTGLDGNGSDSYSANMFNGDWSSIAIGTISAVNAPVCDVTVAGQTVSGVPYIQSYSPTVNDEVVVLFNGDVSFVLGLRSA